MCLKFKHKVKTSVEKLSIQKLLNFKTFLNKKSDSKLKIIGFTAKGDFLNVLNFKLTKKITESLKRNEKFFGTINK